MPRKSEPESDGPPEKAEKTKARRGRAPLGGLNARQRAWFARAIASQSPAEAGFVGGSLIRGRFSARQARDLIQKGLGVAVSIQTARQEMFALGRTRNVTFESRFSRPFDEVDRSLADWVQSGASIKQADRERTYLIALAKAANKRRRGPIPLDQRAFHSLRGRFLIDDELLRNPAEFASYLEKIAAS